MSTGAWAPLLPPSRRAPAAVLTANVDTETAVAARASGRLVYSSEELLFLRNSPLCKSSVVDEARLRTLGAVPGGETPKKRGRHGMQPRDRAASRASLTHGSQTKRQQQRQRAATT